VDLRSSELNGQQAEARLPQIEITVSRNAVRFDPRPRMVSSGRRIGAPAFAAPGFGTKELRDVADAIAGTPLPSFDDGVPVNLRDRVSALADKFPLYRGLFS
jgi:glycine hydroxymethyltransferase